MPTGSPDGVIAIDGVLIPTTRMVATNAAISRVFIERARGYYADQPGDGQAPANVALIGLNSPLAPAVWAAARIR